MNGSIVGSMSFMSASVVVEWFWMEPYMKPQSHVWNSQSNSNPTNSYIKKNTLNDNRSFMFWFYIFTI